MHHLPPKPTPPSEPTSERLREALRLLAEEVEGRIARHPGGHLIAGRGDSLAVALRIPSDLRDGRLAPALRAADEALDDALGDLVRERSVFRPGRAFCLRCSSPDCAHSAAPDPRQVFAGYGPTGIPRFLDFGQLLLERRDPRVETLFRDVPGLVALTLGEADLCAALSAPFQKRDDGFRLLGQVTAGWFRVRAETGVEVPFAVAFQILSVRAKRGRRSLVLNVLGTAPGGGPLEALYDRLGNIPWLDAVRWAQTALASVERSLDVQPSARRPGAKLGGGPDNRPGAGNGSAGSVSTRALELAPRRLQGILDGLAHRLEKDRRARDRRTQHAEIRRSEGDRPTGMALADLARAAAHEVLADVQRDTLVVLGEKGRAHVFNREGRHVTSIRYTQGALDKRRARGLWRPARADEIQSLLTAVKTAGMEPTRGKD
ncbi:MAG TPA: hypothetical protein VGS22_01740 [Thermoanaerobaculia bacterium]|nr:hypothetical protein [Thermoanaerobaculia bacterium]